MTKVLIVDDNEDNRCLLTHDLEDEGYEVAQAIDGVDSLRVVAEWLPDVVLMDINMPRMDGIEACAKLKEQPESRMIPIIMLSARDGDADVIQALNAGAHDYVTKPYVAEVLMARVRAAAAAKSAYDTIRRMNIHLQELHDTAFQFVDNVSHEFRTPLTVIKEFSSIIRDGIAGPVTEDQCEYLGTVIARVDDLALMVDDMLDVSKLEAGLLGMRRKECTIDEIVEAINPGLQRKAAANGIPLEMVIESGLPNVYCDIEKAGRVILNLAVNAIKFSPEESPVTIWARAGDGCVTVGVTDSGPGIDEAGLAVLFERFKQLGAGVRSDSKGFGLGLNIVRDLVDLNLGTLHVESELEQGSTFSFTIPTTDIEEIAGRYTDWLERQQQGAPNVSLIQVRMDVPASSDLRYTVGEALRSLLRHPDLVLDGSEADWVLAIGRHEASLADILATIQRDWHELCGGVRIEALPDVSMAPVGTWRIPDQCDEFRRRILSLTQRQEVVHG